MKCLLLNINYEFPDCSNVILETNTFDNIKTHNNAITCANGLNNVVLMQCTGLKDKNGKLIYEGDIVTFEKSEKTRKLRKGIVEYYLNYCWFFVEVEENKWARPFHTIPDRQYLEVIGNIYENADLLKEGKE